MLSKYVQCGSNDNVIKYCDWGISHNWDMSFGKFGYQLWFFHKINLQGRNKLTVLSMRPKSSLKCPPHTIGCKISQGIVSWMWLQSDGAVCNLRTKNPSNLSILEGLATWIGSHMTREPTASPVFTKWWKSKLMLVTNFGSLCPKVTKVGSQNYGYHIWLCTRLIITTCSDQWWQS